MSRGLCGICVGVLMFVGQQNVESVANVTARQTFPIAEGSSLRVVLHFWGEPGARTNLWYRTRSGTASEDLDFRRTTGSLVATNSDNFNYDEYVAIEIPTMDDTELEESETLLVQFANSAEFSTIVTEATVLLADNERPFILDPSFPAAKQMPVSIEPTFWWWGYPPSTGVKRLIPLPGGAILMVGSFHVDENGPISALARLTPGGAIDQTFRRDDSVIDANDAAIAPDGSIFTAALVNGGERALVKLDPDGRLVWRRTLSTNFSSTGISGLILRDDGTILLAGNFQQLGDKPRQAIAQFSSTNGELLDGFNLPVNGSIFCLGESAGGSVIVAGDFTQIGQFARRRIARLFPDGSVDPNFDAGSVLTGDPTALAIQPDGKIIISGKFAQHNGSVANRLLRLNSDGSVDDRFFVGAGLNDVASRILVDEGGRIVLCGGFTSVHGLGRNRIARLLPDGSVDHSFMPGDGPNSLVRDVAIDSTGKYVISGAFNKIGQRGVPGIARLFPHSSTKTADFQDDVFFTVEKYGATGIHLQRFGDSAGELVARVSLVPSDPALREFKPFAVEVRFAPSEVFKVVEIPLADDGEVEGPEFVPLVCEVPSANMQTSARIRVEDDEVPVLIARLFGPENLAIHSVIAARDKGRIAVTGLSHRPGGIPLQHPITVLNQDGTVDATFGPVPITGSVSALDWTAEQKLIVAGSFNSMPYIPGANIIRLNPDGSTDETFTPPSLPVVLQVAAPADGKILALLDQPIITPSSTSQVIRLEKDGAFDTGFKPPNNGWPYFQVLKLQSDGKILIGGEAGLRRLLPDGTLDPQFVQQPDLRVFNMALAPDGKILVEGPFTRPQGMRRPGLVRLNPDGTVDLSFKPVEYPFGVYPFNSPLSTAGRSLIARTDGKVIVGNSSGFFPFNADGSRDLSLVVSRASVSARPLMVLENGEVLAELLTRDVTHGHVGSFGILAQTNPNLSQLTFENAPVSLREGDTALQVNVRRIGDLSQPLHGTIELQPHSGTNDLILGSQTLSFAPMQSSATFALDARADRLIESDEVFKVSFLSDRLAQSDLHVIVLDGNGRPGTFRFQSLLARTMLFTAPVPNSSTVFVGSESEGILKINPQSGTIEPFAVPIVNDFLLRSMVTINGSLLAGGLVPSSDWRRFGKVYRLTSSGQIDPDFKNPNLYVEPNFILPLTDGKILVGGNGLSGHNTSYNMVRLKADGSFDFGYRNLLPLLRKPVVQGNTLWYVYLSGGDSDRIATHDLRTDEPMAVSIPVEGAVYGLTSDQNSILAHGTFRSVDGASRGGLARITNNRVDTQFQPQIEPPYVFDLALDAQRRIVITGDFIIVNGVPRPGIARLLPNGALDLSFDPPHRSASADRTPIHNIASLADGSYSAVVSRQGPGGFAGFDLVWIQGDLPFEGRITSLERGAVDLLFNSVPEKTYTIESSADLRTWQPILTTNAAGYQIWINPASGSPAQFFRATQK